MRDYLTALENEFTAYADTRVAKDQARYMKNQFAFFGIKTPLRRHIIRPFLTRSYLPGKSEMIEIVKEAWEKPQREFQYFGQELAFKYLSDLEKQDISLFEHMIVHKSWWDTVDFIATKLAGAYFKKYPDEIPAKTNEWVASGNLWLQRSALLFQLKYKKELDTRLLSSLITRLKDRNTFFINKAIGWVLREYSKTNPDWVEAFVRNTQLNSLSRREALRLIR